MVVPILKWAGGKRWLVAGNKLPRPPGFRRYIEPFVGGAAVFFHLAPGRAVLSDVNSDLINFYEILRDEPLSLKSAMIEHQRKHETDYYYQMRAEPDGDAVYRAARFLYLNRTCWNGLYRVNKKGEFNVPIGTKQAVLMPSDDFEGASKLLTKTALMCSDFEPVIDKSTSGDFIFVDPPYTVKHNMNGFLKYNEKIFCWEDQVRLHKSLQRAARRGASICVTNADHASLNELYSDFEKSTMSRQSVLAGSASARGSTTESLFTANIR